MNGDVDFGGGELQKLYEEYRRIELLYRELLATELEQGQLVDGQLEVLTNLAKAYETMNQLVDNMVVKRVTCASFLHAPCYTVARLEGCLLKFLSSNFGVLSTSGSNCPTVGCVCTYSSTTDVWV